MPPKLHVIEGGRITPTGDFIEDVFGAKGYLAKAVTNYGPRPGQISLARAIDDAIRTGKHVVSEGPTGTGKSLAYSVPAIYHALDRKLRVCIVTSNKTLQGQIANKDLADLQQATGWKFTYAVRKGINSYVCARAIDRGYADDWDTLSKEDPKAVKLMLEWARTTPTGDAEDSPGASKQVWRALSTSYEECAGNACPYLSTCFVARAKAKARGADVIITNYHLLYRHLTHEARRLREAQEELGSDFDLKLHLEKRKLDNNGVLPMFDVIILDEAHNAVDIAREHLGEGVGVGFGTVARCLHGLSSLGGMVKDEADQLRQDGMAALGKLWDDLERRAQNGVMIFKQPDECASHALEGILEDAAMLYRRHAAICRLTDPATQQTLTVAQADAKLSAARSDLQAGRAMSAAEHLATFREMRDDNLVYFIEKQGDDSARHGQIELKARALNVGTYMRESLFEICPTVVQTSATLAIKAKGRSDFDHVRSEMGMAGMTNVTEISVPSPFDWHQRSLLVVPETMPMYPPSGLSKDERATMQEAYEKSALAHMRRIIADVRGRTLVLCTSYKMVKQAAAYLRRHLPYTILVQGEGTNRDLQRMFRSDIHSVMIGTESFGEGVDIQGEALSCVILDKLSHIAPSDPVLLGLELRNARYKRAGKPAYDIFSRYRMPYAVTKFKQKCGRLLRAILDAGVIVCLDRRLLTANYSPMMIGSLPAIRIVKDVDAIPPFLRSVGALA